MPGSETTIFCGYKSLGKGIFLKSKALTVTAAAARGR